MYSMPSINSNVSSRDPLYNSIQSSFLRLSPTDRFMWLVVSTSPPKPITKIPRISTTCGGLQIMTSKPNDSCHQLSKGAEVSMQNPPQAAMNAPSGPRNPQIFTEFSLIVAFPANVVCKIRYAQERPVTTAPN